MSNNRVEQKYPQKVFDLLADEEFRELLNLEYIDSKGDFDLFRKGLIQSLGDNSENFIDLFFFIAEKIHSDINRDAGSPKNRTV